MEDLKGNSNASKQKITPVTSKVIVKKETELGKFKKSFFAEDTKSVKGHVLSTVIVPGLQRLFTDIIKNSVDWLIYGSRGSGSGRGGIRGVSYTSYYDRANKPSYGFGGSSKSSSSRPGAYSVNEVTFVDRGEAEETLSRMRETCERYGMVSVADFYDMINQKHSYTDNKYGWKNLEGSEIFRSRDGFSIKFPKIMPIE